jgi:copper chaperone NosL
MKKLLTALWLIALLSACKPEAKPIEYGSDVCEFCKMTIVDKQHAAELVTSKGKVFKFDAIECMVDYRRQNTDAEYALILVNDYLDPGSLIDAGMSTFLISQAIPSPMGAYLSAFKETDAAAKIQAEKGGTLYNWDELIHYFSQR